MQSKEQIKQGTGEENINTKLIASYVVVILAIIILGIASIVKLKEASSLTQKFYEHPFKVTTATKNIELHITTMHKHMQDLAFIKDEIIRTNILSKINEREKDVLTEYQLVFKNYLGDRNDVEQSYQTFKDWKAIREKFILLTGMKDLEESKRIRNLEELHIRTLLKEVDILIEYAQNKAKTFLKNSNQNKEESILFIYVLLFIIVLVITVLSIALMKLISKKTFDLEEINNVNIQSAWVSEGISLLNNELSGDNSIDEVSQKSLDTICNYINAGVGSLYRFDKHEKILYYAAGFAYVKKEGLGDTFKLGEGIVGQVGLQKTPINLLGTQQEELSIESANTSQNTLHTHTFPILYNNKLLGVIELGAKVAFKEKIYDFLRLSNSVIAIGLVTAKQNQDVKNLLQRSEEINMTMEQRQSALDAHSIVGITNIHGTITYANEKFSEVSGYSNEELVGENHRLVNSGTYDDDFWTEMYTTISSGKTWRHPAIKNKTKDGSTYWVDTTIFPFMGSDGKPESYIAIRTDVTKNKEAEIELLKAKEDAEAAVGAKADFLASMSHEIRTPMNGVIGMLDLLSRENLTKQQADNVGIASSSATSLLSLINDILDFSKYRSRKGRARKYRV